MRLIISFTALIFFYASASWARVEMERFSLLRDKNKLLQSLRWDYRPQYFQLEAMGSSGVKSLINDIRAVSDLETKEEKKVSLCQCRHHDSRHQNANTLLPYKKCRF